MIFAVVFKVVRRKPLVGVHRGQLFGKSLRHIIKGVVIVVCARREIHRFRSSIPLFFIYSSSAAKAKVIIRDIRRASVFTPSSVIAARIALLLLVKARHYGYSSMKKSVCRIFAAREFYHRFITISRKYCVLRKVFLHRIPAALCASSRALVRRPAAALFRPPFFGAASGVNPPPSGLSLPSKRITEGPSGNGGQHPYGYNRAERQHDNGPLRQNFVKRASKKCAARNGPPRHICACGKTREAPPPPYPHYTAPTAVRVPVNTAIIKSGRTLRLALLPSTANIPSPAASAMFIKPSKRARVRLPFCSAY